MPRSYGGYTDPQEMQQMAGGNPWYNPLMSTPDWGAGIRSTLNSMWAYKQQKQKEDEERRKAEAVAAQEQRKWELEQKRVQAQIDRDNAAAEKDRLVPTTPPPVDRIGLKKAMLGMGVPPEQAETIDALSDADLVKVKDKFLGRYGEKPETPKPVKSTKDTQGEELAAQIKADRKLLETSIVALGKVKSKVFAYKDMDPRQKQAAMGGLTDAIGRIGEYRKMISSNQPLPQGIRDTVSAMAGDPTGLMTGDLSAILGEGGAAPQQAAPAQAPPQGPPQQGGDVQVIAREIINRAARNGRQLSPQEAEALAIQYLQSKQNAPR